MNGNRSYLVWSQDLRGIAALELQLPSGTFYGLPAMQNSAVDALIQFYQCRYTCR